MADYIKIQSEELRTTAKTINTLNGQLRSQLGEISKQLNSLKDTDIWSGSASSATMLKFNSLSPRFEEYEQVINEYRDFLNRTADQYEQMEDTIEKNVDSEVGFL